MFTTTQNSSRDVLIARMPRMLELEVFELKNDYPEVLESKKYANFRKEYSQWHDDELISRLRILCMNSKKNCHEMIAVYDEFIAC
ncbi:hypothetical protein KAI54_00250 [Candidatus Gracilibacteria bacterium]|nr:hypothetical protein [Candidatus Gracilibacteria bacterium]